MATPSLHPHSDQQNPPSLLEWEEVLDQSEELFHIISIASSSDMLQEPAQGALRAITSLAQRHMNFICSLVERETEHEQLERELDRTAPRSVG